MKIFLDGKLVDEKDAVVSVFDHGLLYGDGVFEGTRIYDGTISFLEEHIDRLFDSAKVIALNIGMTKEELIQATVDTCKANGLENGYIRHVVTRGAGTLGLNPYLCEKASVIIIAAFLSALTPLVTLATILSFLTAPVLATLNHRAMVGPEIPDNFRLSVGMRRYSLAGIVFNGIVALAYVYLMLDI